MMKPSCSAFFCLFALCASAMAAAPEEAALKSLDEAKGGVRILCAPGLQALPAGIAKLLATSNAGLKISVESMPAEAIEPELTAGKASLAIVDAPISAKPQFKITPLAIKGELFAVNAKYGPEKLSKEQMDKVLAGKISDWTELEMPKGPMRVYCSSERLPAEFEPKMAVEKDEDEDASDSAALKALKRHKATQAGNPFLRIFIPVASEDKALLLLEQDPCGIAIVDAAALNRASKGIRFIAIDGIAPSMAAFRFDAYPFAKLLRVVSPKSPSTTEAKLASLLLSPDFSAELLAQGLLPAEREEPAAPAATR